MEQVRSQMFYLNHACHQFYLTGEWQHDQIKAIKIKKHGRLSTSLLRYDLDYVKMVIQQIIYFGNKVNFMKVLVVLRREKTDTISLR